MDCPIYWRRSLESFEHISNVRGALALGTMGQGCYKPHCRLQGRLYNEE